MFGLQPSCRVPGTAVLLATAALEPLAWDSARRHGIADPDIQHAIDNAVAAGPVGTNVDQIDGVLYLGPDRPGRMLEVITVDDLDDELADLLEQRADREGVPRSDIVREVLRAHLA